VQFFKSWDQFKRPFNDIVCLKEGKKACDKRWQFFRRWVHFLSTGFYGLITKAIFPDLNCGFKNTLSELTPAKKKKNKQSLKFCFDVGLSLHCLIKIYSLSN
jgi:hypothetical protein